MKKYLFLNAEDRRPAEESDYRYKKSKPVTAMKAKRDEEGFFIPWAMFRPIGEKGLLCELFGANPLRRAADLRMNRDLLMKEAYEHEVELLMCHIRASEIWMQQEFCKEEQAMELYQKSKIQNMPKLTPDGKRKVLLDALTWKYDCVQQYKRSVFSLQRRSLQVKRARIWGMRTESTLSSSSSRKQMNCRKQTAVCWIFYMRQRGTRSMFSSTELLRRRCRHPGMTGWEALKNEQSKKCCKSCRQ